MTDNLTRVSLIQRLQEVNDEVSWEGFTDLYKSYIYRVTRKMNLSQADADDVYQEVFVKIWKNISDFDHGGKRGQLRGWISNITRNTVLNILKKRKRENNKIESANHAQVSIVKSVIDVPEVDKIMEKEWEDYISTLAWEKIEPELTDQLKTIFLLSLEGVSRQEIAQKLDLPPNTVSVYKKRVVERLQKKCKQLDEYFS
jgi:RNA polymerase sigma factor (sigma-70 family)